MCTLFQFYCVIRVGIDNVQLNIAFKSVNQSRMKPDTLSFNNHIRCMLLFALVISLSNGITNAVALSFECKQQQISIIVFVASI